MFIYLRDGETSITFNTDHIVAVSPVDGGGGTYVYTTNDHEPFVVTTEYERVLTVLQQEAKHARA